MSTYSESTLHLDSDGEEVEFTSVNGDGSDRDTLEKEDCNGHKCFSEVTDEDIRAMEFSTEEEAIKFYITYAHFHVKNARFLKEFNTLMYSSYTPEKFESEWKRVIDDCGVSKNKWVIKTYESKQMWASSYMRDHFVCGVRTTSMCEGVNSFIKKYVQHKNSLVDFLHNFERALKEYRHNELKSDFNSFYYQHVLTTPLPELELEASKIFTAKKFKEVKIAIEGVAALSVTERVDVGNSLIFKVNVYRNKDEIFWVYLDKAQTKFLCDCRRFERRGLPCSHIISVMKYEDMDAFPKSLICKRWSKTAKNDYITSFTSEEVNNEEKMIMFRRGALAAAFNRLCEVSCKSADGYKEALEGMNSLCEKRNKINEVNINGKSKENDHVADDPITVKTKGAPKNKKSYMKPQKHCSHCRKPGHTRRRCPILAGIDFTTRDEGEGEDSHVESDYESSRLNESISHEMNEEIHYSSISNIRYNTDDNIGIKRNREKGHTTGFSTQDSGNQKTSSLDRKTENNGTPRGFGYGVSSSVKHASQSSRWNRGVGYASNYFPMYSGIPTLDGSMFPQFPSTSIPTFHSNNTVLGSEINDAPSNGSFMSVLKDMESSAKHHKS